MLNLFDFIVFLLIKKKDFALMLNQNVVENDPLKIDTLKAEDSLTNDFLSNFKAFQSKYDVNFNYFLREFSFEIE